MSCPALLLSLRINCTALSRLINEARDSVQNQSVLRSTVSVNNTEILSGLLLVLRDGEDRQLIFA